jgi:uncharacterized membrane protein
MTEKTLALLNWTIAVILAIAVGWSVYSQNYVVVIIAIFVAIGITFLLRKNTKKVIYDERTSLLYEKAAGTTMRICVPVAGAGAAIVLALQDHLPSETVTVAYTVAYATCAFLVVHLVFYSYYYRKH